MHLLTCSLCLTTALQRQRLTHTRVTPSDPCIAAAALHMCARPCDACAVVSGSEVLLTCERPGDGWTPGFNASLTATQSDGGCSSTGTATASVTLITAPTASLTGPISQGSCSNASTAAGSFVVQSTANTTATLTVAASGGLTCTPPSATGEVGIGTGVRLHSSAQQCRIHALMSAASARHTHTHLHTHYVPSSLLLVVDALIPSPLYAPPITLCLQSLPTQRSRSRANVRTGQEGGLLLAALT